ncbi:MAG: AGE family epimerase/isomerase [Bacteroidetes bacterium]|nr:AGE family epimerase/isomerase [Bacteroidota bacterium]
MKSSITKFRNELQRELRDILNYWMRFAPDDTHGGFYGSIDNNNNPILEAEKGVVLNARILWTFSAAYNETGEREYIRFAERAFQYIVSHFVDENFGGVYWTVNYNGEKLNDRKQIYGLAFCIYGLSEYYRAANNKLALDLAVKLFWLIEYHAYDQKQKGYFEAFTREWKPIADLRLSAKDANEKKTMNTHLHIAEAYASLYKVWPDKKLKQQIETLLEIFAHHIVDDKKHHLHLFFDENWNVKSDIISFGHDIEAAWLLQQIAETIHHPGWMTTMRSLGVKIADATVEGLDEDGGLNYEIDKGQIISQKHWWPQAEAIIGFFNAFQSTGDDKYLHHSLKSWDFIKKYIRDEKNGEWFWGVYDDHSLMMGYDKAGFWKCPYHNSRACMELLQRTESVFKLRD